MSNFKTSVIVIGAGHAGIEAALASARMGVDTVVFTTNLDAVGNMPCNPSVGGSAKGHLVFELDALGGEMGCAADAVTLQSRTLNLGKGAAVHSKRTQADRDAYKRYMKKTLEKEPNLRLVQSEIVDIITEEANGEKRVVGVVTNLDEKWLAECVILATGTFLESEIFVGDKVYSAGPDGMMPAKGLSGALLREKYKRYYNKHSHLSNVNILSYLLQILFKRNILQIQLTPLHQFNFISPSPSTTLNLVFIFFMNVLISCCR